jgi:hypothetical protein
MGESQVFGLEVVKDTERQVQMIRENLSSRNPDKRVVVTNKEETFLILYELGSYLFRYA